MLAAADDTESPARDRDPRPRRRLRRRVVPLTAGISAVVVAALSAFAPGRFTHPPASIDLYLDGIAVDARGNLVALPPGAAATYLPGSRVVDPAATARAEADRAWLAAGTVPDLHGRHEELVTGALLDLRALTRDDGAVIAAHSPRWRYVWPRDASFAAAAFAVTRHTDDARRVLLHLQDLHRASGTFEARYLPDGSGRVPDDRRAQSDGAGWVLWATKVYLDHLPARDRPAAARELTVLVDGARSFIAEQTRTRTGLPRPSPDYWETGGRLLTLGTAAPLLAGLEAATEVYAAMGRDRAAEIAHQDARRLREAISKTFGRRGYPRTLLDRRRDAATAFLLPPFQGAPLPDAEVAWLASVVPMKRPAGGLAPGASWREDGISWTPQTALYALAAASNGHATDAGRWLDWLARHRTSSGALPEKVLADGSPAAVAPLAWTSALVVLTVDTLERERREPPVFER